MALLMMASTDFYLIEYGYRLEIIIAFNQPLNTRNQ